MASKQSKLNPVSKEILFQVLLHVVIFLFFSFDSNEPQIHQYEVVSFINHALGALMINYVLLPRFFYQKKYLQFFIGVALIAGVVIAVEEIIIEGIYFPDTRAKYFAGIFYNLLDVMPVITVLVGFKFAWDASLKQREVEQLQSLVKESELQYLKSQINPHFLFNNLNNLYSYAIEKSPKTPGIILELSSVLRYMLYDCKEDFVALSKEIEHLENFTRLNELQIEARGEVAFEAAVASSSFRIAPLILSVFVENAFKHSTASQPKDIKIDIDVKVSEKGVLDFRCSNTFRSLTNTDSLSNGIGLENVKKRLQILYPNAHKLEIETSQGVYCLQLQMQLIKETK